MKFMVIVFSIFSLFVCFGLPIILAIYMVKKRGAPIKAVIIGASTFFVVQPLIRIPILQYLQGNFWFQVNVETNTVIMSIFLGLTAGIFEEGGRYIAFKFLLKKRLDLETGIAYGIGHGGCEAMLLVGTSIISSLIIYGDKIPKYNLMWSGIERLCTISIQIALSLIVIYGVKNKNILFLLIAILIHALIDGPAVLIKNVVGVEIYIIIWAVASLLLILNSEKLLPLKGRISYENKKN
jgi:uncharacterized membrane protein YhfC